MCLADVVIVLSMEKKTFKFTDNEGSTRREICDKVAEDVLCDYVKKVKIAVAVAVIRNKPEGTSAHEYAQHLCGSYQKSQLNWKHHSEKLEEELLFIKQQLLMRNLSTSQSDNTPEQEYAQNIDTYDSEDNVASNAMPTPSPSESSPSSGKCSYDSGIDRQTNYKQSNFVSNVMTLRSMARAGYSGHSEWSRSVIETTLQSVENTIKLFESDCHLNVSSTLLQTSIDSFVELVDGRTLPCKGHMKLLELGANFLHVLAMKIVLNGDLNCGPMQWKLCQCIMTLAQSDQLKHGIIRYLVQTIFSFTDELRTQMRSEDYLHRPHTDENMFYVFWCLEQILRKELTSGSNVTLITQQLAEQLHNYLDDAVLHLSETYPMFVHFIWQISDLINKLETLS